MPAVPIQRGSGRSTITALLDALAVHAAADVLDDPVLRRHGWRVAGAALAELRPGACPVFDGSLETPGLRDGLAGVGAALLALSGAERTVSESALLLSRTMPPRIKRIGSSRDPRCQRGVDTVAVASEVG